MSKERPILVTGATGNVGRAALRALSDRGVNVRAGVRAPERARASLGEGVELVPFDFERPETFAEAISGCRGLVLVRPPAISRVEGTLNACVDEAPRQGVEQVVFLSVMGAGRQRFIPHHRVERHLMASGLSWTMLRAGFFAQNLGDTYRLDIRDDDRLFVPAGGARVAFVDARDLGEVAALAFLDPRKHRKRAWRLTGPRAVTLDEVARLLSEALDRPIRSERAQVPQYFWHLLRRRRMGPAQAAVVSALNVGLRFGRAGIVDPTLQLLLGREPRGIEDYIRDHVHLWQREPGRG